MIKQVQIGAIEYKIVEADIPSICGDCDTMNCRIRINKTMHPTIKRVTLWHEIVHGILFTAGQLDHDEQVVDAIAHGIVQVLRDNPELRG